MKIKLSIFLFLLTSSLMSCTVFSPVKNTNAARYQLKSIPNVPSAKKTSATILILHPTANALYNSTQIAYSTYRYQIAYYVKNHWVDTPANMMQQLIGQSLQNTHHYKSVALPPFPGTYTYALNTQLIELFQDFTQEPSVVKIRIRAQLINALSNRVIAAREFTAYGVAHEDTPYGGVIAANEAMNSILRQLTKFCLSYT